MGNGFLVGVESEIWTKENRNDFISPGIREPDGFNSLLTGQILDVYHHLYGHKKKVSTDLDGISRWYETHWN